MPQVVHYMGNTDSSQLAHYSCTQGKCKQWHSPQRSVSVGSFTIRRVFLTPQNRSERFAAATLDESMLGHPPLVEDINWLLTSLLLLLATTLLQGQLKHAEVATGGEHHGLLQETSSGCGWGLGLAPHAHHRRAGRGEWCLQQTAEAAAMLMISTA